MTQEQWRVWVEIVAECKSPQRTINVASRKRRSTIIAVENELADLLFERQAMRAESKP